jgi:hypothetical protein
MSLASLNILFVVFIQLPDQNSSSLSSVIQTEKTIHQIKKVRTGVN